MSYYFSTKVAAIDPVASMQSIPNVRLGEKAAAEADKLRRARLVLGGATGLARASVDDHKHDIERHAAESKHEIDSVPPPGTDERGHRQWVGKAVAQPNGGGSQSPARQASTPKRARKPSSALARLAS